MKKYQRLTDILEAALEEEVSIKSVLISAGAITVGAIIWKLLQKKNLVE